MLRDDCSLGRPLPRRAEPSAPEDPERGEGASQALLLRGSPFAREAGLRLVYTAEGHAAVTLPIHRGVGSEPGKAHPGAITALVEAAAAAAAGDSACRHDVGVRGV